MKVIPICPTHYFLSQHYYCLRTHYQNLVMALNFSSTAGTRGRKAILEGFMYTRQIAAHGERWSQWFYVRAKEGCKGRLKISPNETQWEAAGQDIHLPNFGLSKAPLASGTLENYYILGRGRGRGRAASRYPISTLNPPGPSTDQQLRRGLELPMERTDRQGPSQRVRVDGGHPEGGTLLCGSAHTRRHGYIASMEEIEE